MSKWIQSIKAGPTSVDVRSDVTMARSGGYIYMDAFIPIAYSLFISARVYFTLESSVPLSTRSRAT
jgi:hypothetical protein